MGAAGVVGHLTRGAVMTVSWVRSGCWLTVVGVSGVGGSLSSVVCSGSCLVRSSSLTALSGPGSHCAAALSLL